VYTAYYQLREKPFALTPDPRFLFLSLSHREALAHVIYGVEQGEGFIAVTGEVGTGKTTLCRTLLERLGGGAELAFIFNPTLSGEELWRAISMEYGLPEANRTRAELIDQLGRFLLDAKAAGRRVVLVVDEAQNLSMETLEEVRLLSNLETSTAKLIQIVLFGQPELDEKLDSPALRQLRQRITVRWRLSPLSQLESAAYVCHRVRIAAGCNRDLFARSALREIGRRARGIPRVLNLLADRSLLAAYVDHAARVERAHVGQAAREILSACSRPRGVRRSRPAKVTRAELEEIGRRLAEIPPPVAAGIRIEQTLWHPRPDRRVAVPGCWRWEDWWAAWQRAWHC
jgi:general secretion pathway protein A